MNSESNEPIEIDLRSPYLAALLAWLIPGAGHFYQRRYSKSALFFVCILGTYFFGLLMGGGKVVYASLAKGDKRWQYACQVGVGLPALPAIVQNRLFRQGKPLGDWMRPPQHSGDPQKYDELAQWHAEYHAFFELGTLYTMIAGLLNILAVYDAGFGPFVPIMEEEEDPPPDGDDPEPPETPHDAQAAGAGASSKEDGS